METLAVLVDRAGLHTYQFPNKVLPILAWVSSPIDPVRIVDFRPFIASRRRRNARASSLTRGSSRVGGGSGVGGGVGAGIFGQGSNAHRRPPILFGSSYSSDRALCSARNPQRWLRGRRLTTPASDGPHGDCHGSSIPLSRIPRSSGSASPSC